jgi:hypothetical protein
MLVAIPDVSFGSSLGDSSCSVHFSSGSGVGRGLLSAALFVANFLIAIAVSPPVEVIPPAISAAVVKHKGHMASS